MKDYDIVIAEHVIMFMDIHDYSIVVSRLGKKHYGLMQEVYENLGDIIVAHKGEIIKYLGDAILCVFPAGSEKDVVKCAMELRKTYADIANDRGIAHDTELEVGIGSGVVEIGVFGHKSLRQKDVFGEEVNRAAMIGHHRGIAVTENVYGKVRTDYETRQLPDRPVKWQDKPLRIWEVVE